MTTPTFHLCDVCGAQTTKANRVFVATGYSRCGHEMEPDGRDIDLCEKHAMLAIEKLTHKDIPNPLHRDCEQGKRLLDYIDWMKKRESR